jgi:hypothetical protein
MLKKLSASLLTVVAFSAYAAEPTQQRTQQYVHADHSIGFSVDSKNAVSSATSSLPGSRSAASSAKPHASVGIYSYESASGPVQVNLMGQQVSRVQTPSAKAGDFSTLAYYGQTMSLGPYAIIPSGWVCISGDPGTNKTVMYVVGAAYGTTVSMNSLCPIPLGWGRVQGSAGYGLFRQLAGARYGQQEYLDVTWGIPYNWVRTVSGYPYARFMNVAGAPFGAQIYADSTFPIPNNWLRIQGGVGYGTFINSTGAPSGTQWYVDASWIIPSSGWIQVTNTYPYRWIRKI